ncbi:GNAT family N-acetyltransferase [Clostridium sp.]|jgi:ribosomal protein S18 acetylase RimI-like enzyme|uniref:GNAT family N-acetyltransferase n=1 Tax=Clostridium sp. TaxID=1506 RepID=UPI003EEADC73
MEIKQFELLAVVQKKELYDFIKNTDLTYNKSFIEMNNIYESDTFNDGSSVFILFHKGGIIGSAAVITKEISIKGEAFVTDVYVSRENVEVNLCYLMQKIVEYCKTCTARSVKIGIRESETHLIPYIKAINFTHIYDAVIMKHKRCVDKIGGAYRKIELQPLSLSNSLEYMNIQNESFRNSPNGATIDEVEVKDYIVRYANDEDLIGICFAENSACGVYELSIDGNIGWVNTLGIAPKYQKKGLGSALVSKCIKKLYAQNSDEIKLLVITSNDNAVKIYKENDFEEEEIFSSWFERIISL